MAYHKDVEKSHYEETATRSKVFYDKDVEKGRADTAAHSKAHYHKDIEKSRAESAASSKADYEKDIEASQSGVINGKGMCYLLYVHF